MNLKKKLIEKHRFFRIAQVCGWQASINVFIGEKFRKQIYSVRVKGIQHPVFLRPKTSDVAVFVQIFALQEMKLDAYIAPDTILDAGANIGLSSIALSVQFPNSEIIALEPDLENYRLCCKNTSHYSNIKVIQAALWMEDGFVSVANPEDDSWSIKMEASHSEKNKIKAFSIQTISKEFKKSSIDFLKIDIEGSEKKLFDCAHEWISLVGCILVELHENIENGCELSFQKMCDQMKSKAINIGEKLFIKNLSYIKK